MDVVFSGKWVFKAPSGERERLMSCIPDDAPRMTWFDVAPYLMPEDVIGIPYMDGEGAIRVRKLRPSDPEYHDKNVPDSAKEPTRA